MPDQPVLQTGLIQYDDDAPSMIGGQDDAMTVPYGDWYMENHYHREGMTFAGSNTSEDPTDGALISVVRLGATRTVWACDWTASRLGREPQVPDPSSAPAGWTLLHVYLGLAHVGTGPDGASLAYRISGTYVYVASVAAATPFGDAQYPRHPVTKETAFSRAVSADRVRSDFMAGGGSSYSPTGGPTGQPLPPGFIAQG